MLTCLVPVLLTFYIQAVLKLKNNSGAKKLMVVADWMVVAVVLYREIKYIKKLIYTHERIHLYRVIQNNCQGFNNLLYTIHLLLQMQPHVISFYGVT